MDTSSDYTTLDELERALHHEETNLRHRLRELNEAESRADALRWQVMNVESTIKGLRKQRESLRNQGLVEQLLLHHVADEDGMCHECGQTSPCRTIKLIKGANDRDQ